MCMNSVKQSLVKKTNSTMIIMKQHPEESRAVENLDLCQKIAQPSTGLPVRIYKQTECYQTSIRTIIMQQKCLFFFQNLIQIINQNEQAALNRKVQNMDADVM